MVVLNASCPYCEDEFKLNMIGLEAREFIQCPQCRRIIKLDFADPGKRAIRTGSDFVD